MLDLNFEYGTIIFGSISKVISACWLSNTVMYIHGKFKVYFR